MKIKTLLITVLFLSGSLSLTYSQIIDGYVKSKARTAQNRAIYDADKEVDSQINKAVDNEFNKLKGKLLDKDKKTTDDQTVTEESTATETPVESETQEKSGNSSSDDVMGRALMGKMGINMTRPANMKDVYEFTGNIKMDIEIWDDDGDSEGVVDYTTQYSDKSNGFAMEFDDEDKGKSTMIFDYDNQIMIILADNGSDKSGFATPLSGYQTEAVTTEETTQEQKEQAEEVENYISSFKKTGNSKTIAGFKCDEYVYEDEEDIMSYWMTTELPADLWIKMGSSSTFSSVYTGRTSGFVMESDHRYKSSKERSHMIVKEVNPNQPGRVNTVGYSIMTMNVQPRQAEKSEKEEKK